MVDVTGDVACFGISNYAISEGHNLFYENAGSCFSVFIVMIIPEFWRNKESNSCQIEVTCLFSLRQIYSARIFLIGIVDIVMLTIFLTVACINMKMQFTDLLVQFYSLWLLQRVSVL